RTTVRPLLSPGRSRRPPGADKRPGGGDAAEARVGGAPLLRGGAAVRARARQLPGLLPAARRLARRDRLPEPAPGAVVGEGVLVAARRPVGRAPDVDRRRARRDRGGAR